MLQFLIMVIFPLGLILAAVNDLATMTISNWISIILIGSFAVLSVAVGMPLEQIAWHFAAGAVVLAGCFAMFAFNLLGGGDAKLLTAAAVWFGWNDLMTLLIMTALLGGPLCLAILMFRRLPLPDWAFKQTWLNRLHDPKSGVPYGVAICAAGLLFYTDTPMMNALGA